ncbi:hypothetical protein [Pontibacter liquoris]|uniref:hypothetical protein n=1 Tax=Pontibacter liquoris TaxID=2905677 RepID=UPI001FA6D5CE|nr:hypothetical protein [Pontibacter liquoris]
MKVSKYGLMELAYDEPRNILSAKWSDALSVESSGFLQTIHSLFTFIQENEVTNLIIDSGIPAGGVLTEELIEFFTRQVPNTSLKYIALLESPDYLWDNNLYQVLSLLITTYRLPIAVKLLKSRTAAQEWLASHSCAQSAKSEGA